MLPLGIKGLRVSSVTVTTSTVSCRFGDIYWRNPQWKPSFFVQCSHVMFKWCFYPSAASQISIFDISFTCDSNYICELM